jgi:hypothetical protein
MTITKWRLLRFGLDQAAPRERELQRSVELAGKIVRALR